MYKKINTTNQYPSGIFVKFLIMKGKIKKDNEKIYRCKKNDRLANLE